MVMRIYTGTGDQGDTGLFGGARVPKSDPRVEAYGGIDELNATLGWALGQVTDPVIASRLSMLQPDLFAIGAHLATVPRAGARAPKLPPLPAARIAELESWIDEAEVELPELRAFVMPGGAPGGAALHVARTTCRRAEREVVRLARTVAEGQDGHATGHDVHEDEATGHGAGQDADRDDQSTGHTPAGVDPVIVVYLNRLSDLLFVWARRENRHAGIEEQQWLPDSG